MIANVVGLPVNGRTGTMLRPARFEWAGGTVRDLVAAIGSPVGVFFGGVELADDDVAPDGCVALPAVHGNALAIAFNLVIAAASTYASYALSKKAALAALRDHTIRDDGGSSNFSGAQSTRFGPNFAVPIVGGTFGVRGHVIGQRLEPVESSALGLVYGEAEIERTIVAVSEGPVRRIGGMTGGAAGETERMGLAVDETRTGYSGAFPSGIYKDGVLLGFIGAEIALRMGRPSQSRLAGWSAQASRTAIGAALANEGEEVFVVLDQELIDAATFTVDFPQGLYRQTNNNRLAAEVRISVRSRKLGTTDAWTVHPEIVVNARRARAFADYRTITFVPPRGGPYQVWLRRSSVAGDPGEYVTLCQIRDVQVTTNSPQTYPGTALIEVGTFGATASGAAEPQFLIPVDGLLVRAWDPVTGWTAYGWDAVSPWVYPIGRNPAWFIAELLLNEDWGLGNKLKIALGGDGSEELALADFAEWAAHCDQSHPSVAGRARHEWNFAIDIRRPEAEWMLAIFAAGHAVPIIDGGLLTVTYEYRDAHTRGNITVPARQPRQSLATANCESIEMRFRDPGGSANKVVVAFFDEAQGWTRQTVEQNDDERLQYVDGLPPRVIVDEVEAPGITHAEMARQEAWYRMRFVRGGLVEATLRGGLPLLTIVAGDLFWLQHDCWSPGDDADRTGSMRSMTDSPTVAVSSIALDRAITNAVAKTDRALFVCDPEGKAQLVTIDGVGTYAAGTPVPLWSPANSAPAQIYVARDATVAHGKWGKFERPMKVVGVRLSPQYEVEIDAVSWPEEAFDAAPETSLGPDGAPVASPLTGADVMPAVRPRAPEQMEQPKPLLVMSASGAPIVSWSPTVTDDQERPNGVARLFARPAGQFGWERIAQTAGNSAVAPDLGVGWHDVAVVVPVAAGGYQHPSNVAPARLYVPELFGVRPGAPGNLRATATDQRAARVTWSPARDAARYEIRRGTAWLDAPLVGETASAELLLANLEPGEHRWMVAGIGSGGLIGDVATVTHIVAHPLASIATATDTSAPAMGDAELDHLYTAAELDTGLAAAAYLWSVILDAHAEDARLVGDIDSLVGDDEAMVVGLQSTPLRTGIVADDLIGSIDGGTTVGASTGSVWSAARPSGSRATFATEVRIYNGSWGSWQPYRGPVRAVGSKMQARVSRLRQSRAFAAPIPRIQQTVSA